MMAGKIGGRLASLALACAMAATPAGPAIAQQPTLARVIALYDAWLAEADPISAGQRGDLHAAARWPDDGRQAIADRMTRLSAIQAQLRLISTAALTGEDRLNADVLGWRIDTDLAGASFDEARIPFTSDEGFFLVPADAAADTVLRTPEQAQAWLTRLATLPAYYDTETANLRRGLATGFVQPRITTLAAPAHHPRRRGIARRTGPAADAARHPRLPPCRAGCATRCIGRPWPCCATG